MIVGTVVIGVAMALTMVPILMGADLRSPLLAWLPVGSFIVVASIALGAVAELFTSARMYEYVGAMAPKGQEGLFLGYANLPLALGSLAGGPAGAFIFNDIMARGAETRPDGLLELVPAQNALGWMVLMRIGFGELFTSARMYEYVGEVAPKGQEGLFLGYANLPLAIGSLTGGPAGPGNVATRAPLRVRVDPTRGKACSQPCTYSMA